MGTPDLWERYPANLLVTPNLQILLGRVEETQDLSVHDLVSFSVGFVYNMAFAAMPLHTTKQTYHCFSNFIISIIKGNGKFL